MKRIILVLGSLFFSTSAFARGQVCPDLNGVYRLLERQYSEEEPKENPLRAGVLWFQQKTQNKPIAPEISPIESTHMTFLGEPVAEVGISNNEGSIYLQFAGSEAELIVDGARRNYSSVAHASRAYVAARCSSRTMINIFEDGEHRTSVDADGKTKLKDKYESHTFLRQLSTGGLQRIVRGSQWDQNGSKARNYQIIETYELVVDLRAKAGEPIRSDEALRGRNGEMADDLLMTIVTTGALLRSR